MCLLPTSKCFEYQLQLVDICFMTRYPGLLYFDITAGLRDCAKDTTGRGLMEGVVAVLTEFGTHACGDPNAVLTKLKQSTTDGPSAMRGHASWTTGPCASLNPDSIAAIPLLNKHLQGLGYIRKDEKVFSFYWYVPIFFYPWFSASHNPSRNNCSSFLYHHVHHVHKLSHPCHPPTHSPPFFSAQRVAQCFKRRGASDCEIGPR